MKDEDAKIKKRYLIVFAAIALCTLILYIAQRNPDTVTVELKGQTINVLVAETPEQRFRGLGGRESLGSADGMMFLFPNRQRHGIVMRDMLFSIDVVWFDAGEVVDIARELPLQPDVSERELRPYFPRVPAGIVLELPAGWASEHDLKIGDKITVVDQ